MVSFIETYIDLPCTPYSLLKSTLNSHLCTIPIISEFRTLTLTFFPTLVRSVALEVERIVKIYRVLTRDQLFFFLARQLKVALRAFARVSGAELL